MSFYGRKDPRKSPSFHLMGREIQNQKSEEAA
jgi:hypothetical protein